MEVETTEGLRGGNNTSCSTHVNTHLLTLHCTCCHICAFAHPHIQMHLGKYDTYRRIIVVVLSCRLLSIFCFLSSDLADAQ